MIALLFKSPAQQRAKRTFLAAAAITRATIATHLATTPERISRALRTLETVRAIRFDRHRIVIVRPDPLRDIALLYDGRLDMNQGQSIVWRVR